MRKLMLSMLLGAGLATATGCIVPIYSADPAERAEELIFNSEDFRHIREEWRRIWFLDQPSHLSPYRTHGGLI